MPKRLTHEGAGFLPGMEPEPEEPKAQNTPAENPQHEIQEPKSEESKPKFRSVAARKRRPNKWDKGAPVDLD